MKLFDWFKCLFTKKCDEKVSDIEQTQNIEICDVTFEDVVEESETEQVEDNNEIDCEEVCEVETNIIDEENKVTIEKYAHKNDLSLTEFVIEHNVEKIELSAFYGCINLKKVYVKTDIVPELGKTVFQYRKDNKLQVLPKLTIYVNKDLVKEFKNDKMWSKYVNNIKPII